MIKLGKKAKDKITMYVDMVEEKFARSSTSMNRFDLTDNIIDMFNIVKSQAV